MTMSVTLGEPTVSGPLSRLYLQAINWDTHPQGGKGGGGMWRCRDGSLWEPAGSLAIWRYCMNLDLRDKGNWPL